MWPFKSKKSKQPKPPSEWELLLNKINPGTRLLYMGIELTVVEIDHGLDHPEFGEPGSIVCEYVNKLGEIREKSFYEGSNSLKRLKFI